MKMKFKGNRWKFWKFSKIFIALQWLCQEPPFPMSQATVTSNFVLKINKPWKRRSNLKINPPDGSLERKSTSIIDYGTQLRLPRYLTHELSSAPSTFVGERKSIWIRSAASFLYHHSWWISISISEFMGINKINSLNGWRNMARCSA